MRASRVSRLALATLAIAITMLARVGGEALAATHPHPSGQSGSAQSTSGQSGSGGQAVRLATADVARVAGAVHVDSCGIVVTAHRGDDGPIRRYDENTLGAARRALATDGAGATEFDLRSTRNNKPGATHPWWVMHDKNVRRTTDGDHAVATATPRYLRGLHTRDGSAPPAAVDMLGLAADLTDRGLQSELTSNPLTADGTYPQGDVDRLLQLMVDKGVWSRVVISSFDVDVLRQVATSPVTRAHGGMRLVLISGKNFSTRRVAGLPGFVTMVDVPLRADVHALAAALHRTGRGLSVRDVDSADDLDVALDVSGGQVGPDHADDLLTDGTSAVVSRCKQLRPAGP